jgi:predicted aconitase
MLKLTDEQKKMVDGRYGAGTQKAISMLMQYGNAFDAERLIKVDSVHSFSSIPLEFLSAMLDGVEQVRSFSTLHALKGHTTRWARAMGIRSDAIEDEMIIHNQQVDLCQKAGFYSTFTCAPYLSGNILRRGMVFSWPGSSGIIIGNSLFGATCNRDAVPAALCSAITGLTPEMFLHKRENRFAEMVVELEGIEVEKLSTADLGALGYYIGGIAGTRNVAITGIPPESTFERMKYLLSPLPVSGAVSLCHIIGVSPDAPTLNAVIGDKKPEIITVNKRHIEETYHKLSTAATDDINIISIGCPHCTIAEIKDIAQLINGKKVKDGVRLWIITAEAVYVIAKRMGFIDIIEEAGGLVVTDVCISGFPFECMEQEAVNGATNSARAAHYQSRPSPHGGPGTTIKYGSTQECINAAIKGKWGG